MVLNQEVRKWRHLCHHLLITMLPGMRHECRRPHVIMRQAWWHPLCNAHHRAKPPEPPHGLRAEGHWWPLENCFATLRGQQPRLAPWHSGKKMWIACSTWLRAPLAHQGQGHSPRPTGQEGHGVVNKAAHQSPCTLPP